MKDMVLLLFYFIKATMTNIKKTNQSFFHTTLLFIMKDCKCRLNSVQSPKNIYFKGKILRDFGTSTILIGA
ncbi:hypothetical protein C3F36_14560 [Aeromonas sp. ASNIH2]|nr:hypothetical protein C3F36_14560 [Aeromonas sp. ASNIH2]RWS95406.1 hypothetical protein DN618_18920 [Aeromonas caviae]